MKRNKRKDRSSLLKPQKLERKKKKAKVCHCAGGDRILGINNAASLGLGGLGAKKGRERKRSSEPSTAPHHMSVAICLLLFFLCLTCPPSECVLFSQLLAVEGGHKQTQIKEQAALAEVVCVPLCGVGMTEINGGVKTAAVKCFVLRTHSFALAAWPPRLSHSILLLL